MSTLKIKGSIWLENSKGQIIGPGKKKLLEAIQQTGSIKAAAKSMKMSYRQAWEITNTINRIYSKPVVEKSAGGLSGGGTRLTKEGEELIAVYKKIIAAFDEFKVKLNQSI
jgi:molybdate transport system regulatory protein